MSGRVHEITSLLFALQDRDRLRRGYERILALADLTIQVTSVAYSTAKRRLRVAVALLARSVATIRSS